MCTVTAIRTLVQRAGPPPFTTLPSSCQKVTFPTSTARASDPSGILIFATTI